MITHKIKIIGESEYTLCGLRYANNFISVTQCGEVTCKKCLKLMKDSLNLKKEKQ